jgi:hypothetical protein
MSNNISSGTNYDLFDNTMHGVATDLWSAAGIGIGIGSVGSSYSAILSTSLPTTNITTSSSPWTGFVYDGNLLSGKNPTETFAINGNAAIEGDLKVKGKSLSEAIENIEKRLAILHPNKKLEEKWEQLKVLGTKYRELEKDILEKEKIWETLKK